MLTRPGGKPYPHSLNVRHLSAAEAELVYNIYVELLSGKQFTSVIDLPGASGLTATEALSLLVYEGDQTDRYIGDSQYSDRHLKLQGNKVYYGTNVANPAQFVTPEGKAAFIKHLQTHMRHNFVAANLGGNNSFASVKSTSTFTWFGKEIDARSPSSYREFLLGGENPIATSDIPH